MVLRGPSAMNGLPSFALEEMQEALEAVVQLW